MCYAGSRVGPRVQLPPQPPFLWYSLLLQSLSLSSPPLLLFSPPCPAFLKGERRGRKRGYQSTMVVVVGGSLALVKGYWACDARRREARNHAPISHACRCLLSLRVATRPHYLSWRLMPTLAASQSVAPLLSTPSLISTAPSGWTPAWYSAVVPATTNKRVAATNPSRGEEQRQAGIPVLLLSCPRRHLHCVPQLYLLSSPAQDIPQPPLPPRSLHATLPPASPVSR